MKQITLAVNSKQVTTEVEDHWTLLDFLREKLDITGPKKGCEAGECGACTVLMNGSPVSSCLILAAQADGSEIITAEGLAKDGKLDPLQQAFIDNHAIQCGFCTPGFIITLKGLLNENPNPTEQEIKEALVGNLCRCGCYPAIIEAALATVKGSERKQ